METKSYEGIFERPQQDTSRIPSFLAGPTVLQVVEGSTETSEVESVVVSAEGDEDSPWTNLALSYPSDANTGSGFDMDNGPDSTPKWVEERVARSEQRMEVTEERVGRMTDRVEGKIDSLSNKIETKISSLDDKVSGTRTWVIGVGTTILVVMVSLFIYALNQTSRVEDRVFENTQRIEEVAPESGQAGSTPTEGQENGQ